MTAARTAKRADGRAVFSLRIPSFAAALVLAIVSASCQSLPDAASASCTIEGPLHLAPRKLSRLHPGLSKTSVDRIMGPPTQSPAVGQYYYPTGGLCPLGDPAAELSAPCGLVAHFLVQGNHDPSQVLAPGTLESCWWGAIVYGFARE